MPSPFVALSLAGQLLAMTAGMLPHTARDNARRDTLPSIEPWTQQTIQPPAQFDPARFDSATASGLRKLLDSAAELGIPTGPLVDRALEGAARRVNGAQILKVVRAHMTALLQARDVLGTGTPAEELDAGARALRAGVDANALAAVRATRAPGAALIPLVVLTDIVQRGVPQITARDAVASLSKQPGSDEMLKGLQSLVAKNAVRGPGMAVDALNRYLRGTVSGATPPSAPATTDRKPIRPPPP